MAHTAKLNADMPAVWHVVFNKTECSRWYDRLSPPGFRHCLAYGYSVNSERWIIYNPTDGFTEILCLTETQFQKWLTTLHEQEIRIVAFRVGESARIRTRMGFWCTIAIKHLLGLPCGALRPIALYKYLLRNDGELIHEHKG